MKDLASRVAVAAVGIPAVLALLYVGGWALGPPRWPLFAARRAPARSIASRTRRGRGRLAGWAYRPAALVALAPVLHPDYADAAPVMMAVLLALGVLDAHRWPSGRRGPKGRPLAAVSVTVFGAAYAGLPLAFVLLLHALPTRMAWGPVDASPWVGAMVVALPLARTWVGDAAAYFLGTAWGRAKLFPTVSPNKSWVGAWAGVVGCGGGRRRLVFRGARLRFPGCRSTDGPRSRAWARSSGSARSSATSPSRC